MVDAPYIPERGDLLWLTFDPTVGHEQSGRRPALVLSPRVFNRRTGLALVCPITRRVRDWGFEVSIPDGLPVSGVVRADQARVSDWRARDADFIGRSPDELLYRVTRRVRSMLE